MSDLATTLTQTVLELSQVLQAQQVVQETTHPTQHVLDQWHQQLSQLSDQLPPKVRAVVQSTQEHTQQLETRSQQLQDELRTDTQALVSRSLALENESRLCLDRIEELRLQLLGARQKLAEFRNQSLESMDQASRLVGTSLSQLSDEVMALQAWVRDELMPTLKQTTDRLTREKQELGEQILQRQLPALCQEYEAVLASLSRWQLQIADGLHHQTAETSARATYCLERLAETINTLCHVNAEQMHATARSLELEQRHLWGRSEDLIKQAKIYAEIGTPAGKHLKALVDLIQRLEELLIANQILPPRPEELP